MPQRVDGQSKESQVPDTSLGATRSNLLQRKCECGSAADLTNQCTSCRNHQLVVQPKLTVGEPGDRYEQEADQVADTVMRMSEQKVQRQPRDEEEEDEDEWSLPG